MTSSGAVMAASSQIQSLRDRSLLREAREVAQRRADAPLVAEARAACQQPQRPEPDVVRIAEELADDQAAAGFQNSRELAQRRLLVGNLAEDRNEERRVVDPVLKGHRRRIGLRRGDVGEPALANVTPTQSDATAMP